ncbi:hypothetical protein PanWU01x14_239920 [Parasponia andersonii]|uniref:Uncharacterized protein n=1 Tax=Parasponia andersonii TaxID=3476 RepID=A0A2P5BH29_PARAD|nr:hypothetical protein PanWU01x14_239920 [Parasponia andersonii]
MHCERPSWALIRNLRETYSNTDLLEAEALATITSMKFAMISPWRFIVLERDNSEVMNNLMSRIISSCSWRIYDLVEDCRSKF